MVFKDRLPDPTEDEMRVVAKPERLSMRDPLKDGEQVPVLQFLADSQPDINKSRILDDFRL